MSTNPDLVVSNEAFTDLTKHISASADRMTMRVGNLLADMSVDGISTVGQDSLYRQMFSVGLSTISSITLTKPPGSQVFLINYVETSKEILEKLENCLKYNIPYVNKLLISVMSSRVKDPVISSQVKREIAEVSDKATKAMKDLHSSKARHAEQINENFSNIYRTVSEFKDVESALKPLIKMVDRSRLEDIKTIESKLADDVNKLAALVQAENVDLGDLNLKEVVDVVKDLADVTELYAVTVNNCVYAINAHANNVKKLKGML